MATKTIGIREDVYERLRARKREDESFTDLIDRLVDETSADWREGFGSLTTDEASELRETAERARERESRGRSARQHRVNERLTAVEDLDDETA